MAPAQVWHTKQGTREQPWGQGLATPSEDLSSVSSTPHPPWLQLCPLLVSMGTALTCTITHIYRSRHINKKMVKQITITAHFTGSSCHLTRSLYKVQQIPYHVFSADWHYAYNGRPKWAGQSGQAAGSLLRGSRILSLVFSHTLQSQAPSTQLHNSTPLTGCPVLYLEGDTTQNVYEISNWPPKIKSSDCQMFLCVGAWESGVEREERKDCILRKTNRLETGRQSKQPQTSRSQQGLSKQREFIIRWRRSLLTGFSKPRLNRRSEASAIRVPIG